MRILCPSTTTTCSARCCGQRRTSDARIPSEPVWVTIVDRTISNLAGSHNARTVNAGRPFFMMIGVIQASNAPAASSCSMASASTSPVTSSTLTASSTATSPSVVGWEARSPTTACTTLGRFGVSAVPAPKPTDRMFIAGIDGPDCPFERTVINATPVGVASSMVVSTPTVEE